MARVTVFSAPKSFSDPHINLIQRNAVRSWKALGPEVDVLLVGDEPGMKEVVDELNVKQLPDVNRNELGTPLVSSIFSLAREASSAEVMIYLNADIILLPECLSVIDTLQSKFPEFLLVGQRWDLDIDQEIDFSGQWLAEMEERLAREGRIRTFTAMDYFIFPRKILNKIPPFAIGRAGWDNWMIYNAVNQPWPVIDITPVNRVVHQNHDYGHLPNGAAHYDLEESYQNVALAGGVRSAYDLLDVPLIFRDGQVRQKGFTFRRLLRRMERWVMPEEPEGWRWQITRSFRKLGRRIDRQR